MMAISHHAKVYRDHKIVRVSKSHRGGDSTPRVSLSRPTIFLRVSKFQCGGDFTPRMGLEVTTALWREIYTNMGIFLFHKVFSLHHNNVGNF